MRRISMAILRATAQHLLSGLDIIGPNSIYASEERRRQTSASEAEHDEYRGGAMAYDDSIYINDDSIDMMSARLAPLSRSCTSSAVCSADHAIDNRLAADQ